MENILVFTLDSNSDQAIELVKMYDNRQTHPLIYGNVYIDAYQITHYSTHGKRNEVDGSVKIETTFHLQKLINNLD